MGLKLDISDALEPVQADSPTARAAQPKAAPAPRANDGAATPPGASGGKRARRTSGQSGRRRPTPRLTSEALEQALGAAQKPIATRMATDLWDAAAATAERLDVPLRLLLTHAVVSALEVDDAELLVGVRATERRERLSQIGRI